MLLDQYAIFVTPIIYHIIHYNNIILYMFTNEIFFFIYISIYYIQRATQNLRAHVQNRRRHSGSESCGNLCAGGDCSSNAKFAITYSIYNGV